MLISNRLCEIFKHIGKYSYRNAYKSASSSLIKKEFPQIKQKLWKEYFWSRSFCLISTGEVTIETIKNYIQSQGAE